MSVKLVSPRRWAIKTLFLCSLSWSASVFANDADELGANQSKSNEQRNISNSVSNVVINGPLEYILKPASQAELMVGGDSKLVNRVLTKVEGNTLYISTRGIFITTGKRYPVRIELSLPQFDKVQLQGSADGSLRGFKQNKLELNLQGSGNVSLDGAINQLQLRQSGSGDITMNLAPMEQLDLALRGSGDIAARGQVRSLQISNQGSGNLNLGQLKADYVYLQNSGQGDVKVMATQEIKGRLSGAGDLTVLGKPVKRNLENQGAGEIYWD